MRYDLGEKSLLLTKKKLRVMIDSIPYLIVLVQNNAYMIPDTCPHQDASLFEGTVDGTCVTCPLHHATFDVVTGEIDDVSKMLYFDFGPEKITTHKVIMDGDRLVVEM